MRIRGKRVWLTVAAIVAMLWLRHGRNDDAAEVAAPVGTKTTAAQSDLSRFIAHLPTPAQLKLHPFFIEVGELRLEGQTIDADKQPIGGAKVTLDGSRTTVSEADGSFSFDKLSAADYVVAAEKDTFFGEDTVTLTAESDPDELEMKSGPSVRLHVVDRDGNPIRDAAITANLRETITDADGNAMVRGIDLGEIRIVVIATGFGPDRIDVRTGDDIHAVIAKTIVLSSGTAFGGTVVDELGKPVLDARVTIEQGRWRDHIDVDEHGKWSVPCLAAGKVNVSAYSKAYLAMPDEMVDHDGLHAKLDVVVHVKLGARATGIVVDAQGKPVADAMVSVGDGSARSEANGRFVVEGFAPGLLAYSASNDFGSSAVHKLQIDRAVEDLRIELVESSIAGVVRNTRGEPVEDATIQAKGIGNDNSGYGHSDELGKFDLGGIPPGEYEVIVQRGKDRMGAPEHGVVTRTTNRQLALVVSDLGTIAGHVVIDGAPVEYFGIAISDDPDPRRHLSSPDPVRTSDGAFALKDLRPGTYAIAIVGPSFKQKLIPNIHVTDGGLVQLGEISVDRGRIVHGTVRDGLGQPIAGALVAAGTNPGFLDDPTVNYQIEGTRSATTDALGNYELAGLDAEESDQWIQATHDQDMAKPQQVAAEDTVVDLVIVRTGTIDGRIINPRDTAQTVHINASPEGLSMRVDADATGQFHFDRVPPGDYVLSLGFMTTLMIPIPVHVASDATTPVTIELTKSPITLVVTSPGCDNIQLLTPSGAYVDIETCKGGAVELADVMPGAYQACTLYDQCVAVTVTSNPSRQAATIPPKPPEPSEPDPTPTTEPADPTPAPAEPEPDPDDEAETQAP